MKRILIFSLNYYPFVGGAEVAIKEITDRLSTEEFEFHLIALQIDSTLPKSERMGNVFVHRIGFATPNPSIADLKKFPLQGNKYYFQVAAYLKAVELHRKYRFNATWAMMAHSCAIPAGLFKKRFPEVPYLLTLQEGDPPAHIERIMRPVWPLFKQGFTSADALQPISTFLLQWGKRMGFSGDANVIPNGVDVVRFTRTYSEEEKKIMREALGKKDGDVFIVTTSRLYHKNAIDDVIRALPLLPENISFLVYGIGPEEESLRALAKELGIESRARFMGQISHADMPLMLSVCDIFTRPSRSEGMGNSFIEAMAAGLPVIATQEGGIADFLFDSVRNPERETTGWAVDVNSPEQIAAAVKDILKRPEHVEQVKAAAKALALSGYDWNQIAQNMKILFARLTGGA